MRSPLYLAAGSMLDTDARMLARAAAAAGFEGIGLRCSAQHALDPVAIRDLQRIVEDLGLRVHDVEVHRLGTDDDPTPLIEHAAALEARYVLVVSDHPHTDAGDAATEDALGSFARACRSAGVAAAVEYMAWTVPHDSVRAVQLASATDSFVVVDLLHHHRLGEGPRELAAIAASGRLGWVQLCDAPFDAPSDLVDEARHHRCPPGTGGLPLGAMLAALPDGTPLSVEVQSDVLSAALQPHERAVLLHRAARRFDSCGDGHGPSSTG